MIQVNQHYNSLGEGAVTLAQRELVEFMPKHRQPGWYLVLENKWHVAFLLAGYKPIEQHRKATDEGLSNGPWPCLADNHVTGCHPFRHVVHKAFDGDLQQHSHIVEQVVGSA